jgi:hypothetical protein
MKMNAHNDVYDDDNTLFFPVVGYGRTGTVSPSAAHYRGASGVVIAYDQTNRLGKQRLAFWIDQVSKHYHCKCNTCVKF